jgi:heme exporter protein D
LTYNSSIVPTILVLAMLIVSSLKRREKRLKARGVDESGRECGRRT